MNLDNLLSIDRGHGVSNHDSLKHASCCMHALINAKVSDKE